MYVERRAQRFRQGGGTGNESETNGNPETHMSKNVEYRKRDGHGRPIGTQSQFARVGKLEEARMSERARHTGDGVARRKAHQERQRDEREQREEADRAAGTALPPEEGGVELVSADDVLKGVAETGPNYTLLPKRERKAKRRR